MSPVAHGSISFRRRRVKAPSCIVSITAAPAMIPDGNLLHSVSSLPRAPRVSNHLLDASGPSFGEQGIRMGKVSAIASLVAASLMSAGTFAGGGAGRFGSVGDARDHGSTLKRRCDRLLGRWRGVAG